MPNTYALPDGSTVEIIPRSEWEAAGWAHTPDPCEPGPVGYAVEHHTAGNYPLTAAQEVATMRRMDASDKAKGYAGLQYSHCVAASGRIYEGRGYDLRSAATRDLNRQSYAHCLLGYHDSYIYDANGKIIGERTPDPVTPAAVTSLGRLIALGFVLGKYQSGLTVLIGHKENPERPGATACPGTAGMAALPAVAAALFAAMTPQAPPPPPPPPAAHAGAEAVIRAGEEQQSWYMIARRLLGQPYTAPYTAQVGRLGNALQAANLGGPLDAGRVLNVPWPLREP